jgi:hypothetical protein
MKSKLSSVPLFGCIVTGLATAACSGASDPTTQGTSQASPADGQTLIAQSTLRLEKAFSDQFDRGQIDRVALQGAIADVIQAMPEEARPKVQQHIAEVLDKGEKLASELTPEQRAALTVPPKDAGELQLHQIAGWGWPGAAGFGGYGAFGFPGMYSYGWGYPYGVGYGGGYASGYSSGYSTAYSTGYGLGTGGWYW